MRYSWQRLLWSGPGLELRGIPQASTELQCKSNTGRISLWLPAPFWSQLLMLISHFEEHGSHEEIIYTFVSKSVSLHSEIFCPFPPQAHLKIMIFHFLKDIFRIITSRIQNCGSIFVTMCSVLALALSDLWHFPGVLITAHLNEVLPNSHFWGFV